MRLWLRRQAQPDGRLWECWSRVQGAFPIWRMPGSIAAPGWQQSRLDSLGPLRTSGGMRRVLTAIADADDAELDAVIALAD